MQVQGIHEPNLLVCQTDESDRYHRFFGEDCVSEFIEFCEDCTEGDERSVYVIAHNLQAYDGYFVLKQYYKNGQDVTQIRNGAKLMQLTMDNVRFIDSLNFFQMPLANFPKTFGLTELKKSFFPHLFNLPENQHYVGPIPAKDYFMTESMSLEKKKEFDEWYEKQVKDQVVFDFAKEIVEYCDSDVQLLREGCMVFKKLFMDYTGFNSFDKVTLASACNDDLRRNCMIKDTIASEPVYGWSGKHGNQLKVALEWLSWLNYEKRKQASENMTEEERQSHDLVELAYPGYLHPCHMDYIKHAGNGGEFTDPRMKGSVDGYEQQSNVIYQFHGCFYHGCPDCYRNRAERHTRLENRTMYDAYDKTKQTMAKLKSYGYTVIEMWECMWTRMKANNKECADYVKGLNFVDRLNPHDAFFGGRTNAVKIHHQVSDTEKIHYIDFTSLYPFINKTARYPLGHPKIITNPGTIDISEFFGLIKCKIVAPFGLFHPVLPFRAQGKLLFPLCKACTETELQKPYCNRQPYCEHYEDQCEFISTWCSPEIEKAVELGYEVKEIYEVWNFEQSMEGLFAKYVNKWLKLKQEASGWPEWCQTEEGKQRYIDDYEAKEGIRLDYDNIIYNAGLRSLAKLMLNSMWGKFGQQLNKTQVKVFADVNSFHEFLDDKIVVEKICIANEELVEVFYTMNEEDIEINPNLNIFIACFTTCWACLRLYNALEKLGLRVLYFDTDSVIFLQDTANPNEYDPPLGDYLGGFTSELKSGDYITEFVCAGPKNYGYRTASGKTECKVKGFRLNTEACAKLNYQIMRDNLIKEIKNPKQVPINVVDIGEDSDDEDQNMPKKVVPRHIQVPRTYNIVCDPRTFQLETRPEFKDYQLVYDKRVIDFNTFGTFPYGFFQG